MTPCFPHAVILHLHVRCGQGTGSGAPARPFDPFLTCGSPRHTCRDRSKLSFNEGLSDAGDAGTVWGITTQACLSCHATVTTWRPPCPAPLPSTTCLRSFPSLPLQLGKLKRTYESMTENLSGRRACLPARTPRHTTPSPGIALLSLCCGTAGLKGSFDEINNLSEQQLNLWYDVRKLSEKTAKLAKRADHIAEQVRTVAAGCRWGLPSVCRQGCRWDCHRLPSTHKTQTCATKYPITGVLTTPPSTRASRPHAPTVGEPKWRAGVAAAFALGAQERWGEWAWPERIQLPRLAC